MADILFSDVIERVYRRAMGGIRERTVTLNGNITSGATTATLAGPQTVGIAPGVILAMGMELALVILWNSSTLVATLTRGYLGSTAAAQTSGELCYINPRYSRFDCGVAINDDLNSLSSPSNGLFRVGTATITYNPVFSGYDLGGLPANFLDILAVRYKIAPPYRTYPAVREWKVLRDLPSSDFPSNNALVIYDGGWPGLPLYVTYSAPFIPLVALTDSLENTPAANDPQPPANGYGTTNVVNLTSTMVDLPPLGAEIDLTQPREISRNFMESQPDPRKAIEVVAGAVAGSVNALVTRRASRISEEADRLVRQYTRSRGW